MSKNPSSSEHDEPTEALHDRMDMMTEKAKEKDDYRFYIDEDVSLTLRATRGHDIRTWETEITETMRPGDAITFECGGEDFRLKLLGVEEYTSQESFRPDGLEARVAIDRYDDDEWKEYVEKSGPENCVVVLDLSYSIEVEFVEENE